MLRLDSERLLLRNHEENDLKDFLSYRSDPEVVKYQGFDVFNEKEAYEFILSQKDKEFGIPGEWLQLAIILKDENRLIGDCAVKLHEKDTRMAEIGCTLSRDYQKRGYGKEALLTIMRFLFTKIDVHRIVENTDAENSASIALFESLGFRKEGHFIENIFFKGKWGSEMQYAMLRSEWEISHN